MISFCWDMLGLEEGHQFWPGLQQVSQDGVEGQLQMQGGRYAQEEDGSVDVLGVIFFDQDWFADAGEEELGILRFATRRNKLLVLGVLGIALQSPSSNFQSPCLNNDKLHQQSILLICKTNNIKITFQYLK